MNRFLMATAAALAIVSGAHAADTSTLAGQWIFREVAAGEGGCLLYLNKAPSAAGILEVNFDSSPGDCPVKAAGIEMLGKVDSWSVVDGKIVFADKAKAPVMELSDSKAAEAIVFMDAAKEYQLERIADLD